MALRSLSLCSGVGGIDLGLSRWCRTVGYVEREAFAQEILLDRMEEARLDRAPIFPDLEPFPSRAFRGAVDVVVAGFPCPPFSQAGARKGADDERYLWPLVRGVLARTRAPLAFLENVWGAVRHPDGLGRWLSDLARLGFDAEWTVVRASDVGAPHERARVFVLACRDSEGLSLIRSLRLLDGERTAFGDDADGRGEDVEFTGRIRRERHGENGVVGDASSAGLAERDASTARQSLSSAWPPSPYDADGWREYIALGGPQPVVRGGPDGPPDRVDRLRALGNAVVPEQAASAFRALAQRLTS